MIRLKDLIAGVPLMNVSGSQDEEIQGIAYSSKDVKPGWLFAALSGKKRDGFAFIEEARSNGARAFLAEYPRPQNFNQSWVHVQDARESLALCAANFYAHPSRRMSVIGITGTNGKTTTTYLVEEILKQAKLIPGVIGTITYRAPKMNLVSLLTTPEAPDIQKVMRDMLDQGVTHCMMEVSSHSLELKRVWGIMFSVVVFTNLSGEHLDFHQSMEAYFEAKKKLFFLNHSERTAVINGDDPWGQKLIPQLRIGFLTYGLQEGATVRCSKYRLDSKGIEMEVAYQGGEVALHSSLLGRPNIYNILAASAICLALKVSPADIKQGIAGCRGIPGRFERVENSHGLNIYVDFAHTDVALRSLLESFRELSPKRLIVVFGAGGDRDRTKRPRMGKAAGELADWVFLTSDNPRSEDPLAIISEIEQGLKETGNSQYVIYPDRKEALEKALAFAEQGDYIIVAGKGHEDYQILGDRKIHFSDTEVIREILGEKGKERDDRASC